MSATPEGPAVRRQCDAARIGAAAALLLTMTTVRHKMQRIGNQIGVWMYRVSDGRLASHSKNITVLMITAPGRRTGVLHSTCVRYLDTADGFLVWGTASGAPRDPDWFRNLRKAKTADVQIGAKTLQVRPRELLGAERD